jgi:lipopolysaccharide export system permease protein
MPIYCRYLFGQYLKVFVLCTLSFIAVLLTTRLDDIAHFATLGAEGAYVLWFTLYQIPYILPIAIPISSLISAVILIQRLSSSHEITAFRASGMSISGMIAPILLGVICLSFANFYIVSELATHSHLSSGLLKNELRAINPLLLMHNKHLMRFKGIYFDTLGASRMGELASKAVVAMPNKNNNRINLLLAENLKATPTEFIGEGMTLITSLQSGDEAQFDHLVIENIGKSETAIEDFSQMLQKKVWVLNNDHLKLSLLLSRIREQEQHYRAAQERGPSPELKSMRRTINRSYSEIIRRISVGMMVFSLTFMGIAFSINIGRYHSSKRLFSIIGLSSLYLISYFTAKTIEYQFVASSLLYLLPHLIIIALSAWVLYCRSSGRE